MKEGDDIKKDPESDINSFSQAGKKSLFEQLSQLGKVFSQIEEISRFYKEIMDPLVKTVSEINALTSNLASSLALTKEKKSYLDECVTGWTRYRLSFPIDHYHSFSDVREYPKNKRAAKSLCELYAKPRRLDSLTSIVRLKSSSKTMYLNEAKKSFKNGCYLACSSLLFSLCDSALIDAQGCPNPKKRRKSIGGIKAEVMTAIDNEPYTFAYFLLRSFSLNRELIFADGEDFSHADELSFPNRNYVDHGEYKKKVTKEDCVKLFLFLNNVFFVTDYVFPSKAA